jgi:hypothetical protein
VGRSVTNPSKQKGTAAERKVRDWFRSLHWPHAKRLVPEGSRDPGDIQLGDGIPVTIEVKDWAKYSLAEWWAETQIERDNNGHEVGLVIFKRAGKGNPRDWFVLMDGATVAHLLHRAGYLPGYVAPPVVEEMAA